MNSVALLICASALSRPAKSSLSLKVCAAPR